DRVPDLPQPAGVEQERVLLDVELVVPLDELRTERRREGEGRQGEQHSGRDPGAGGPFGGIRRGGAGTGALPARLFRFRPIDLRPRLPAPRGGGSETPLASIAPSGR